MIELFLLTSCLSLGSIVWVMLFRANFNQSADILDILKSIKQKELIDDAIIIYHLYQPPRYSEKFSLINVYKNLWWHYKFFVLCQYK